MTRARSKFSVRGQRFNNPLRFLGTAALCAISFGALAQNDVLNQPFGDGIPNNFKLINYDGMGFDPRSIGSEKLLYYGGITPNKLWFAGDVDDGFGVENTAALSASRRNDKEKATDNWMISPAVKISAGDLLRWDARSVLHGFSERYAVMVSTNGGTEPTDFELLTQIEDETYEWSTHVLSLEKYVGQQVRIAFVHNSTNKYILAVDNLRVGPLTDRKIVAKNYTKHFPGNVGTLPIDLRIFNYGREMGIKKVFVEIGEQEVASFAPGEFTMPRASYVDLSIPLKVEPGNMYSYTVKATLETDVDIVLATDAIWCNELPRVAVAEKFTGTWCSSCTRLTPLCYRLESHFGEDMIVIEPHFDYTGADDMTNSSYGGGIGDPLSFSDYPTMLYNRGNERYRQNPLKVKDTSMLTRSLEGPVKGEISLQAIDIKQPGIASLVSYVTFNEDIDNSDNALMVGYAAIQREVVSNAQQQNGVTMLGFDFSDFNILPSKIPADAFIHDNVPVGDCFPTGVAGSLPATIEKGKTYKHIQVIEFPDNVDLDNLYFVAYLIDDNSAYKIINAAKDDELSTETLDMLLSGSERLQVGDETSMRVISNLTFDKLDWSSSNDASASVTDGVVKGMQAGEVLLTVKNGKSEVSKNITVYDNEPQSLIEKPNSSGIAEAVESAPAVAISGNELRVIANGEFTANVYGVDGILRQAFSGIGTASISLESCQPGIYFVNLKHDGKSETFKMVLK